jgi:hypothetical protein
MTQKERELVILLGALVLFMFVPGVDVLLKAAIIFVCLAGWAFSLYSKEAIASRKWDELRTRRRSLKGKQPPTPPPAPAASIPAATIPMVTWNKISRMVDPKTADRLIDGVLKRHPDRSIAWAAAKVLWDLERDKAV